MNSVASTPRRPVLRYHGGKWMLAPWIIAHFPPHRVYVEAFGGAGSVLMRKPRAYAEVYNDLDRTVVELFRVLRDRTAAEELIASVAATPFARQEFVEAYEETPDRIEAARRTIIRAFMGFGSNAVHQKSGFRANSNRSGTTPAHDWRNYPNCLRQFVDRMQGVVIENGPAVDIMRAHDGPETLHYCDPPYVASTRDAGTDYRFEMTDAEHRALLADLRMLDGMVVLSGYRCSLYDDALDGWLRLDRAAHADGAKDRTESLWLNPAAQHGARQGSFLREFA